MERLTHVQEDALGDLLQSLRLHSTLYCRATMCAPWGFGVPPRAVASFHLVIQGTCWLTVEGMNTTVSLAEGDLVILPHGHAHTIIDHPNTPVTRIEDLEPKQSGAQVRVIARGGPGAVTTLVCGGFLLEETINPLISMLPPVLLISSIQEHAARSLQAIVQLVQTEASTNQL